MLAIAPQNATFVHSDSVRSGFWAYVMYHSWGPFLAILVLHHNWLVLVHWWEFSAMDVVVA